MRYITNINDVPQIPHLAILLFTTRYVEADQRSADSPGHGYPARNEPAVQYLSFDSQPEVVRWLSRNPNADYQVIDARPRKVETTVTIRIP